ncbi:hypothetical protein H6G64_30450 [Calothrix sp. FACHB-156]|nr:hypothetical protein [Calothrix sp. FACHB-156]
MIKKLINILLKMLPDDTLCWLEEEFFKEMERRNFIIYVGEASRREDDLNQSGQN